MEQDINKIITIFSLTLYLSWKVKDRLVLIVAGVMLYTFVAVKYSESLKEMLSIETPLLLVLIKAGPIFSVLGYAIYLLATQDKSDKDRFPDPMVILNPTRDNIIFWSIIILFNLGYFWVRG